MAEILETVEAVKQWLDEAPQRHQRASKISCSCGWRGDMLKNWEPVPWEQHYDPAVLGDLTEVLGSQTSDSNGRVSCAQLEIDLYATIDAAYETEHDLLDALTEIACGTKDPATTAATAVTTALPNSIWAEWIKVASR